MATIRAAVDGLLRVPEGSEAREQDGGLSFRNRPRGTRWRASMSRLDAECSHSEAAVEMKLEWYLFTHGHTGRLMVWRDLALRLAAVGRLQRSPRQLQTSCSLEVRSQRCHAEELRHCAQSNGTVEVHCSREESVQLCSSSLAGLWDWSLPTRSGESRQVARQTRCRDTDTDGE